MFLYALLVIILLLIVTILWLPVVLFIDTNSNTYYVQLKGLIKANIEENKQELIRIKLRVFFKTFYFYPLKWNKKPAKIKAGKKGSSNKKTKRISSKTGLKILKSFRIKKYRIDIDTGDFITNAKMYAFANFLNTEAGEFKINFEGRNSILLFVYNRPIYIIKAFINV